MQIVKKPHTVGQTQTCKSHNAHTQFLHFLEDTELVNGNISMISLGGKNPQPVIDLQQLLSLLNMIL